MELVGEEILMKQRNAFYEMQHEEVSNGLLGPGSFCSDFHTVLEKRYGDDDDESTDEDRETCTNLLLTKEPTECPRCAKGSVHHDGVVILTGKGLQILLYGSYIKNKHFVNIS